MLRFFGSAALAAAVLTGATHAIGARASETDTAPMAATHPVASSSPRASSPPSPSSSPSPTGPPSATPSPSPTASASPTPLPKPAATPTTRPTPKPAAKPTPTPSAPQGQGKVLYLSFDDGPDPTWTPQVLDVLAANKVHATFFMIGSTAAEHPALIRTVRAKGHTVGSHTFTHANLTKLPDAGVISQLAKTRAVIGPTTCTRPPYGAVSHRVTTLLAGQGQHAQLWDIDTRDWAKPGVPAIVTNVLTHAKNGAVVLMHDGGGNRSETVAALKTLLPKLRSAGWRLESIPGC